jgi:hypothetical protein
MSWTGACAALDPELSVSPGEMAAQCGGVFGVVQMQGDLTYSHIGM